MPANLPPAYHKAEEAFRQARSVGEKIECLEEMLRIMPKHKGTDKLQAGIKARIAKLRRQPQKKGATRASHMVRTEGAGQVVLVGPPNAGKSALVAGLTRATPEVADYPFTTREPVPGMMEYEDIAFQLIDLPPLSPEHSEPWVFDLIRHADLLWLVVRATNSIDELRQMESLMTAKHIMAYPSGVEGSDSGPPQPPSIGWSVKPALLVITRLDEPGGAEDVEILKELLDRPWPMVPVSATAGTGMESLPRRTFEALDVIRVYTKQPGKPPDRNQPYTFRRGATVGELARTIHKEVDAGLRFARIWGADVFDGQTVQREHVLADGDVIEIHT